MGLLPAGYVMCPRCDRNAFRPLGPGAVCAICHMSGDQVVTLRAVPTPPPRVAHFGGPAVGGVEWFAHLTVQFDWAMSKNRLWRHTPHGPVLARDGVEARDNLVAHVRHALAGRRPVTNKVWIRLLVVKPDHTGDAVNMVDFVCDAVKLAIPVDDRWYSMQIDWTVEPGTGGRLQIAIGQPIGAVDSQVCSRCGLILALDAFGPNRANRNGRTNVCDECKPTQRAGRSNGV